MRRSPEKLIARLRNRRSRIIALSVCVVVGLGVLAYGWFVLVTLYSDLVPKEADDVLLHVVMNQYMILAIANIGGSSLLVASLVGIAIGLLLTEVSGFTKNDLLANLWDRVQALERSQPANLNSQVQSPKT